MNKNIFLVVISKKDSKTNQDQDFVWMWEIWKMQMSSQRGLLETKTTLCSRHRRVEVNAYFKYEFTETN